MEDRKSFSEGIGLRLFAVFLMTAMSAAVHGAADHVPIGQIMFWRSSLALIPICLYMVWRGEFPKALKTERPGLHATRSLFGALSMALSFLSLAYLPIANAQALAYLAPVLVLPLAAVMLHEKMSIAVYVAIALGFFGVVLMLWEALALPGEGAIIGIAAGLGFAFTWAFVRVHTKTMTLTESTSAIAFYFAVVASAIGLATLPFGWVSLDTATFGWLLLAGLLGGAGHIASNEATARAPVSTLAPLDYTGLIWALGFDLLVFSTVPGALGMLGILTITCAAIIVTFFSTPGGRRRN